MADAPEIKVKLTAEDQGVAAAIKELGSNLKSLKTRQDETASSALRLTDAFKGLIAAIAIDRLVVFGKEVFESGVNIARMTQMTGASAGTLSAAYYKASEELGIGTEVVDKAFVRLSKSIIEFQQGSTIATKAFGQLGISQKDFIGLNTDQKIRLVTDRLGEMKAGTEKAGLAQLILSRSGAQALPVLNALAGEGFAEATKEAKKFGLYLDDQGAASMLHMKNELGDLEGEAKGAALQFEIGLIPALADVAAGVAEAISGSGSANGFLQLGQEVGKVVQGVTYGLVTTGQKIAEVITEMEIRWQFAMDHLKSVGKIAFDSLIGNFSGAMKEARALSTSEAGKDMAAQIAAVQKQFQDANAQSNLDIFGGAAGTVHKPPSREAPQETSDQLTELEIRKQAQADQLAKAALEKEKAGIEGELAIQQAGYKQQEQDLKDHYERGLLSTGDYYKARQNLAAAETSAETAALEKQIIEQQTLADRLGREAAHNRVRGNDASRTPAVRSAFTQAAARDAEEQTAALQKVEELQKKIAAEGVEGQTKIKALETERFKAEEEGQTKVLAFQKEIAALEGKGQEVTKADIAQESEKYRIQLEQAGQSKQQIDAEIAQFTKLKSAQQDFDDARKKTEQDQRAFELEKQNIQIQGKANRKSPLETEQEINELIRERLPLLQADAAAELGAAKKTGNDDNVAAAQGAVQGVQNIQSATTSLSAQLGGSLSSNFTHFFETVGRGTQSVAQQFRGLAASVVASIEQMLVKLLLLKIAKAAAGGGGGGGFFSGLFGGGGGGHATGGLIKGPGGPKDDAIPARVSAGEYIVNAAAVKSFGAHNLEAINRGMKVPSLANLALSFPKYAEGGLVGPAQSAASGGDIKLGIGLDEGLILQHLSSKQAGRIILQHLTNNPKAASKALSRAG